MKTLLVCERSAGHVFPALALAGHLRRHGSDVCFFVTSAAFKERLSEEKFKCYGKSFAGRNIVIEGIWRMIEAVWLLIILRPARVIGFGGRDSFFLVAFSAILRADTWIYEPNVVLGKANKILSFFVRRVLRGFSSHSGETGKVKIVGVPLRDNIRKIDRDKALTALGFDDRPVILCFGGSQGAAFINKIMLRFLEEAAPDCNVIHLTGKREYFQISQLYNKINRKAFVKDFHFSMELLYSAADLVISRCGASALGEIAYYKLPAVLIPYPKGGRHQEKNAFYFRDRGAACVFLEENFSFIEFRDTVIKLIDNEEARSVLKNNLSNVVLGVKAEDFYRRVCAA